MTNITLKADIDENGTVFLNLGKQENTTNDPVSQFDLLYYYDIEKYLWIFYPILLVIGTIGNVLNVIILYKLKFHKNATYALLFILALTDITVLFVHLKNFIIFFADVNLFEQSELSNRFSSFLSCFSMQFSSWILVLVTVVRFIKTFQPLRHSNYKNMSVKRAIIAVLVTGVVLIGINLDLCIDDNELFAEEFFYINIVFQFFLPTLIMIVLNSIICWEIRKLTKMSTRMTLRAEPSDQQKQNLTKRVTWMLVVTTSYFVVASIPCSICKLVINVSTVHELTFSRLLLVETFFDLLWFSQFALNFYLYTATNQKFRKELTKLTCNVYRR